MKRTLGLLTLSLILGAPALAQNQSTMTYHLQLNGVPSMTPDARYDTSTAVEQGPFMMPGGIDILNWAVRLEVGGTIDGVLPGGAANIVFDLALKKDGVLVLGGVLDTDGGFGIGTPGGEAGFLSVVMDQPGGGPYAQQPAAFPWVFDTFVDYDDGIDDLIGAPYARLIDPVVVPDGPDLDQNPDPANGVNMAQYSYPATYRYYRPPGAATPVDPTMVGAPSGTLVGMRAGYENFNWTDGFPERGGVGLSTNNGLGCFQDIGNRPIAEGQINMKGMPPGTCTLELTAGPDNSVLLPQIACSPDIGGTQGTFAIPANVVSGSTIEFIYVPIPPPPVPWVSGAASKLFHGGAVAACIGLPLFAGGIPTSGNIVTESRRPPSFPAAHPWTIDVTFDMLLGPGPVVTATGTNGDPTLGTPTVAGNVLSIPILAWNDANLITLSLTNISGLNWGVPNPNPYVIKVIALQGDVNGNQSVNVNDINQISSRTGQPVTAANCRYDINANGSINVNDVNLISTKTGHSVTGTYP